MVRTRTVLVLAGALSIAGTGARAAVPVGAELQVNTYTTGNQRNSPVSVRANGDFVVVWQSYKGGVSLFDILGQRFSSSGARLGGEFQVNTYTTGQQSYPQIGAADSGDFVVVWTSNGQDGSQDGLFGRRFSSAGAAIGGEFQINVYTSNSQYKPALAAETNGDFVVAWTTRSGQDGNDDGIFGRRFSSSGAAIGVELQVNTYTTGSQDRTAIATDADGDFVVVWTSYLQDGDHYGVFGQRFSSSGSRVGAELQVNTFFTSAQIQPSVAMEPDGDFVVVWLSFLSAGGGYEVVSQRFASGGAKVGGELQVNLVTAGSQDMARVAADGTGAFVAVWENTIDGDGNLLGIFRRSFDSSGTAAGLEFQVNTFTTGSQYRPSIGINASGSYVVTWASYGEDGDTSGIFAQRFREAAASPSLDVDQSGAITALTDGLLVLRQRFGFGGATLTTGAVDTQNCARCGSAEIAAHIAANLVQFDADGDGACEPLTDGLLILRYLFGFRGTTLTAGAVDTQNCARCDATAIEPYIAALLLP